MKDQIDKIILNNYFIYNKKKNLQQRNFYMYVFTFINYLIKTLKISAH